MPKLLLLISYLMIICGTLSTVSCQEEDTPDIINPSNPSTQLPVPTPSLSYQLVWEDNFEGDTLDEENWSFQIGDGCAEGICGWGNNELEYYTDRSENVRVEDGKLIVEARKEAFSGYAYTSGRIVSKGKAEWRFGKIEIRAKLPKGQGVWPAIWMLPTQNVFGGWPKSGEIDIMELVGHKPEEVHGTIHYGPEWPNNKFTGKSYRLRESDFSEDFHTFSLIWERNLIIWEVDGDEFFRVTPSTTANNGYPFNEVFHLILNVAVGGNWPGSPDQSTAFPQRMEVDYIRVYQLQ